MVHYSFFILWVWRFLLNHFAVIKKSPSDSFRIRYLAQVSPKCLLSRFLHSPQKWYFNSIFFCDVLGILHLSMPYLTVPLKFIKHPFTSPPIFKPLSTPHFHPGPCLHLCFMLGPTVSELPNWRSVLYSEFVIAILQDSRTTADGFCLLKHLQLF